MGMAAGQARLLSITARLSDNEQNGQALSFAKQRLADEADQINREYNEALNATKLTVLTGFNGSEAQYTDISYGLLTEYNRLAGGKQYLVTNQKGQILVTDDMKTAYESGNGDFNRFINYFGLSQCDVDFASLTGNDERTGVPKTIQVVHDAWDKYLTSVGLYFPDIEHDESNPYVNFGWDLSTKAPAKGSLPAPNVGSPYVETLQTKMVSNINSNGFTSTYYDESNNPLPWGVQGFTVDDAGNLVLSMKFTNSDELGNALVDDLEAGKTYTMRLFTGKDSITNEPVGVSSKFSRNPDYTMVITDNKGNKFQYWLRIRQDESNTSYTCSIENKKYDDGSSIKTYSIPISSIKSTGEISGIVYAHIGSSPWTVARQKMPLNFEGTTKEQRELYDYAVALTQAYDVEVNGNDGSGTNPDARPLDKDDKHFTPRSIASNPDNASEIQYYRNIFNQMQQFDYVTEADMKINLKVAKLGVKDNNWFEQELRQGTLLLKSYDASKGDFVNTTYAEDSNIQEVEDDRRIAKASIDYDQAQQALERKDKRIDLELKKLETEHNALQTEYDSVKNVVDKNIEKTFNIFS